MPAELIELNPNNADSRKIKSVISCLQSGGIIIYPTDTVYAMGCDIYQSKALERLCKIKGIKPQKNNFSFICHDLSHIADYAKVSNSAFKAMKKVLPGAFTFILKATNNLPKVLDTNKKTIGIRIPDHEITRTLVRDLGNPIITTSIKDEDDDIQEYPNEIDWIYERYKNEVDMIIDAGWCGIEPSTVIDATTDVLTLVREGAGDSTLIL